MRLTTEDGTVLLAPDLDQLRQALSRLGLPGNGFAILGVSEQSYIQTSGSRAAGYVVEYREGSEAKHFTSKRTDIPHGEMIEMFAAYLNGGDWTSLLEWERWGARRENRAPARTWRRLDVIAGALILPVFFAVGAVSLWAGFSFALESHRLLQVALEVRGTVVDMLPPSGRSGYRASIKYFDHHGRTQVISPSTRGSLTPAYYVGEEVVVIYDPSDVDFPRHARIRSFSELWAGAMFLTVGGCAFIGMAGAYWWQNRATKNKARHAPRRRPARADRGQRKFP